MPFSIGLYCHTRGHKRLYPQRTDGIADGEGSFPLAACVVFNQVPEVVEDTEILVDDVLLDRPQVKAGQDMDFLGAFGNLQHEFKEAYGCFSCCRGAL